MDAVKFMETWKRICDNEEGYCTTCEVRSYCCTPPNNAEKIVEVIEAWAKEHPVKTRQSELLKVLPNVSTRVVDDCEVVVICPSIADKTFEKPEHCRGYSCPKCEKDYWLQEVK